MRDGALSLDLHSDSALCLARLSGDKLLRGGVDYYLERDPAHVRYFVGWHLFQGMLLLLLRWLLCCDIEKLCV